MNKTILFAALLGLAIPAHAESCGTSHAAKADDIVTTAVKAGSFKTLATALTKADLVGALQGDGPFTVFAPTDEAFAKLPKGTLETLLKPENLPTLKGILLYHVVPGKLSAKEVMSSSGAKTLNGQKVDFRMSRADGVQIDKAKVVKADIACSNGIIHVIDTVVLPEDKNLVEVAHGAGQFQSLLAAAKAAGLAPALSGKGPFTVFAPTDAAFGKLPAGTVENLLKPENREKLAAVLSFHVVPGRVYAAEALKAGSADTLLKRTVQITSKDGKALVEGAKIVATDIDASNGVIHVIDAVMLPSDDS